MSKSESLYVSNIDYFNATNEIIKARKEDKNEREYDKDIALFLKENAPHNNFFNSLYFQLREKGSLSPRQISAVQAAMVKDENIDNQKRKYKNQAAIDIIKSSKGSITFKTEGCTYTLTSTIKGLRKGKIAIVLYNDSIEDGEIFRA